MFDVAKYCQILLKQISVVGVSDSDFLRSTESQCVKSNSVTRKIV